MFKKMFTKAKARSHALLFGMVAALAAPFAFAEGGGGEGLAAQVLTKLAGVEADVTSILSLMIGVLAMFVLYRLIRKATGS